MTSKKTESINSELTCLQAFRNAVDEAGIVAITDVRGRILEVNDNFCEISGYSRDELLGANHRILRSDHHPMEFFKEMYRKIANGKTWRGDICNRTKNGDLYWVDTTIVPLLNQLGKVGGYLTLRIDISEQKDLVERLQQLAHHDPLTGLPNRVAILESIQKVIDLRSGKHFALLFMDIDRFKLINDSLGHDVGDKLLQEFATRLRKSVRATDLIQAARLGGDEFVVLLENISDPHDATLVAERLMKTLAQPYELGGYTIYSKASVGIVTSEHLSETASEMLSNADMAMYEAKAAKMDRPIVFDRVLRDKAQKRLYIENELRDVIARNELKLFYQPIVELESGAVKGVEALIRWFHTESGLINPDEFIPVAEEMGMIIPIGNFVIDEACRQLGAWRKSLGENAPANLHVNVSRKQLEHPTLVTIVKQAIQKHQIPPDCLHLEVTESIIMHDRKTSIETLNQLKKLGVHIDVDDFGTGYSSLSCLGDFPIDVLKLDREFIKKSDRSREVMLIHALIILAEKLGLEVIAEGIETPEQLALLRKLGCGYGQGFFFSKPLSAEDVALSILNANWNTPHLTIV
ncbi:EAL domain-containing protein [uncultured Gimesia sp.]|uniref:putative bifunctional diguanylate cyclase/phosphodiesterase n=1 Tax=uncultured Gimesia sp. TaxID=1678688 RepID=UPI00262312AF|nr:EAL domain-containing protein [uncultured Gimesia sp.]